MGELVDRQTLVAEQPSTTKASMTITAITGLAIEMRVNHMAGARSARRGRCSGRATSRTGVPSRTAPALPVSTGGALGQPVLTITQAWPASSPRIAQRTVLSVVLPLLTAQHIGLRAGSVRTAATCAPRPPASATATRPRANRPWRSAGFGSTARYTSTERLPVCALGLMRHARRRQLGRTVDLRVAAG